MSSKNEQKPILASETQLTSSTFKHEAYDIYKELRASHPVYPLSLGEQY
ncbi:cytochrome P450, partial [Bacillus cereus group sp. N21]|nr:cytochrome P450 [Bacillus cereus group sp. N21]